MPLHSLERFGTFMGRRSRSNGVTIPCQDWDLFTARDTALAKLAASSVFHSVLLIYMVSSRKWGQALRRPAIRSGRDMAIGGERFRWSAKGNVADGLGVASLNTLRLKIVSILSSRLICAQSMVLVTHKISYRLGIWPVPSPSLRLSILISW